MPNPLFCEFSRQPWMMEPERMRRFINGFADVQITDVLAAVKVETPLPYRVEGDTGIIPISGVLLKSGPGWLRILGLNLTGYNEITSMLQMALADPAASRIELRITSPGGQVAGGMEAAEAIRSADAVKPVHAVIEDLGASGAYWLAASARRIQANANAEVGSIGVYTYYTDWTGFDAKFGLKTIVIRSGPHKGMGLDTITDAQIAAVQEVIDGMAGHFIDHVSRGRRVSKETAAGWATGRVWLAPAALEMGLIDAVTAPQTDHTYQNKEIAMEQKTEDKGAVDAGQNDRASEHDVLAAERQRVAEIKSAFCKDSVFALEAIEAGWSLMEAKAIRHDRLAEAAASRPTGDRGVPYNDSGSDAGADFMVAVKQLAKEQKISKTEAMRQVQQDDPDSYARFLASESQRRIRNHSKGSAGGRVTV